MILGKTRKDQNWIDDTIESGVGGCQWKRPPPRPAGIDTHTVGGKVVPVPPPPKKKPLWRRALGR